MEDTTQARKDSFIQVLLSLFRQVGIYIIVGLGGALLLLYLFAELTEDLLRNQFSAFDDNFELWVHGFANPVFDFIFNVFTTLGGTWGIILITAIPFLLLAWRKHYFSAMILVTSVLGGFLINTVLKNLFQRPRPELWESTYARPTSFSFPSGHATLSLCMFGALMWIGLHLLKSRRLKIVLTVVLAFTILMVGLSRVYFGVHYPTDVIGGYLSGGFWLVLLVSGDAIFKQLRLPRSRDIIPPLSQADQKKAKEVKS